MFQIIFAAFEYDYDYAKHSILFINDGCYYSWHVLDDCGYQYDAIDTLTEEQAVEELCELYEEYGESEEPGDDLYQMIENRFIKKARNNANNTTVL